MKFAILLVFTLFSAVLTHECDSETECSDDETCCQLDDDLWGCCPIPNAVCCSDRTHCCPSGTKCDSEGSRCINALGAHAGPMRKKKPAKKIVMRNEFNEVVCPDKASKCPDGSTCCQLEQGSFGCCPVPQAVCCPDQLHCCPHGFECHGQFCSQNYVKLPKLKKFASTSVQRKQAIEFLRREIEKEEEKPVVYVDEVEERNEEDDRILVEENDRVDEKYQIAPLPKELAPIKCGTGQTCPAKSTCCEIETDDGSTTHMCCPLSNAVCCSSTCCPSGYHCIANGKCERQASLSTGYIWRSHRNQ